MKIGWALDMIGWAFAQPFPTLATPLLQRQSKECTKYYILCDNNKINCTCKSNTILIKAGV